jgi:ribonucleotide monophosphatase NagD (HAD superfamily)
MKIAKLPKIDTIVCLNDPIYWGRELQICIDYLCYITMNNNHPIEFHTGLSDFLYASENKHPRLGAGVFQFTLEKVYEELTGEQMNIVKYGKPARINFDCAENILFNQFGNANIETIFMVGDNPNTDTLGANNASNIWKSILVTSGLTDTTMTTNIPNYRINDVGEIKKLISYLL